MSDESDIVHSAVVFTDDELGAHIRTTAALHSHLLTVVDNLEIEQALITKEVMGLVDGLAVIGHRLEPFEGLKSDPLLDAVTKMLACLGKNPARLVAAVQQIEAELCIESRRRKERKKT